MTAIPYAMFWRINTVTLLVLVTVLSLTANPGALKGGFDWTSWLANLVFSDPTASDKIEHFLAYAALGFSSFLGFVRPRGSYALVVVAGVLIVFGGLLEVMQAMGGHRQGDVADLMANLGGLSVGMIVGRACLSVIRSVRRSAV